MKGTTYDVVFSRFFIYETAIGSLPSCFVFTLDKMYLPY